MRAVVFFILLAVVCFSQRVIAVETVFDSNAASVGVPAANATWTDTPFVDLGPGPIYLPPGGSPLSETGFVMDWDFNSPVLAGAPGMPGIAGGTAVSKMATSAPEASPILLFAIGIGLLLVEHSTRRRPRRVR